MTAEHPTACPEWQDDLAAWLMAQVRPEREALLDAHLRTCPTCQDEAQSLLAVTAVTLAADVDPVDPAHDDAATVRPPAELGRRIDATIAAQRRRRWWSRAGLAAVAGAAAVLAVAVLVDDPGPDPVHGEPVAFAVMPPGASARAVVGAEADGSLVELVADGLEPATTYALWLSPPGATWEDRVAAGTFRTDEDGAVSARLACALPADLLGRVWVTSPEGEIALDTEPAG